MVEIDTLRQLNDFSSLIENLDNKTPLYRDQARAMRENLTFIGNIQTERVQ